MKAARIGLTLLLLSVADSASAQDERRFEISPFGGYLLGGTVLDRQLAPPPNPTGFREHIGFDDGATVGLRAGYMLSRRWEIELQASRSFNDLVMRVHGLRSLDGSRAEAAELRIASFHTDYLMAFGTFHLGNGATRPYLTLGAGAGRLEPRPGADPLPGVVAPDAGRQDVTHFAAGLGVGVKRYFGPRFGLRVDARGYATRLGSHGLGFSCAEAKSDGVGSPIVSTECQRRSWLTNGDVTAGLILAF